MIEDGVSVTLLTSLLLPPFLHTLGVLLNYTILTFFLSLPPTQMITEFGTHAELLAANGSYAALYKAYI